MRSLYFRHCAMVLFLIVFTLSGHHMIMAQPLIDSNAAVSHRPLDDNIEVARGMIKTAELAIKASDRNLTIVTWWLGACLGGSILGGFVAWYRLSKFMKAIKAEIARSQLKADDLLSEAAKTAAIFDQVLKFLPLLFTDGIDSEAKIRALNTLAQLRRAELAPVLVAFMRNSKDTKITA